jgi:hypothetical protein
MLAFEIRQRNLSAGLGSRDEIMGYVARLQFEFGCLGHGRAGLDWWICAVME